MSQHIGSSMPAPRAKPWIAAISGFSVVIMRPPEVALAPRAPGLDVRGRGAELADVGAGRERALARPLEDHDAHLGVIADGVHDVPEEVAHVHVDRVQDVRAVQGDPGDAAVGFSRR